MCRKQSLSEMISSQFNALTVEEGKVILLSPTVDPDKLGFDIPADHTSKVLGIWRFKLEPNSPIRT